MISKLAVLVFSKGVIYELNRLPVWDARTDDWVIDPETVTAEFSESSIIGIEQFQENPCMWERLDDPGWDERDGRAYSAVMWRNDYWSKVKPFTPEHNELILRQAREDTETSAAADTDYYRPRHAEGPATDALVLYLKNNSHKTIAALYVAADLLHRANVVMAEQLSEHSSVEARQIRSNALQTIKDVMRLIGNANNQITQDQLDKFLTKCTAYGTGDDASNDIGVDNDPWTYDRRPNASDGDVNGRVIVASETGWGTTNFACVNIGDPWMRIPEALAHGAKFPNKCKECKNYLALKNGDGTFKVCWEARSTTPAMGIDGCNFQSIYDTEG